MKGRMWSALNKYFRFSRKSHPNPSNKWKMITAILSIALSLVGTIFGAPADPVFKLTDNDFDHFLKDKETMLVDFYAPW